MIELNLVLDRFILITRINPRIIESMIKVTDQMDKTQLATTFMQEYIPKYWHFVDRSNDGLLDYSEFKMAWSDIASILVQVGLQIDGKYRTSEIG